MTDQLWDVADRLWVRHQRVEPVRHHRGHEGRHRGEARGQLYFISLFLLGLALIIISLFF